MTGGPGARDKHSTNCCVVGVSSRDAKQQNSCIHHRKKTVSDYKIITFAEHRCNWMVYIFLIKDPIACMQFLASMDITATS